MNGNKSAHSRRNIVRGLLVMAVIFIIIMGAGTGEYFTSWKFHALEAASAESVPIKNKPMVALMQDLPPSPTSTIIEALPASHTTEVSKASVNYNASTEMKKNQKKVYITFDDGPSVVTAKVLDILQQEGIRATFFVLGNQAKSRPELIHSIWEQGHAIGNHTYNHNYHDLYSGFTEFWSQIKQTEEIVRGITGVRPQLIRAPGGTYGHFDNTYFQLLKQAGYSVIDWTVDSGDSKRKGVPAAEILKESTANMKAAEVVLLLHDGSGHEESAKALPDIIARYKAAGYVFDVLDKKIEPVQFRISAKASTLERSKPSSAWIASNINPNAELFTSGKPLALEVGKLETKLKPGEYAIHEGQYMVPLRAVIERLGGQASWDAVSRSGKVTWNGKELTVDVKNELLISKLPNGIQKVTNTSVKMIGGSIWISLRDLLDSSAHPPLAIGVTEVERRVKAF